MGRSLADEETLQGALSALQSEVVPTPDPAEADPAYRRSLATALLYKVSISRTLRYKVSTNRPLCFTRSVQGQQ